MAGWSKQPVSLEYDDEELFDRATATYEPPSFPFGCQFDMAESDVERAAGEKGKPGDVMRFSAMAEVTSVHAGSSNSRVELRITEFAGDDGKFFDIKDKPDGVKDEDIWQRFGCICLCGPELEKMGLEADCELGDTIHLIGEARLESVSRTENRGDVATLQITHLTFEDESTETREG